MTNKTMRDGKGVAGPADEATAPTVREDAQHSSAPWHVRPFYEDGRMIAAHIMPPKPFTGPPLAEVFSTLRDANVMAAAPDLLAALKDILITYDGTFDVLGPSMRLKIGAAIAAVKKAEGRK